jgi:hypothetical protein
VGYRPRAPSAIVDCGQLSVRYSDSGYRKVELQEYPCSEGHSFGISTGPAAPVGGTSVGYTSTGSEVAERNMPQRKQPMRLKEQALRHCSDRYIGTCKRWMRDLRDAIGNGEEAYMRVSERVLDECGEVQKELSTTPPGVLKWLSPLLVAKFIALIDDYDLYVVRKRAILHDSETHLSVCTAVFRCVLNRSVEGFDTLNTSHRFQKSMILQNLHRVPGLLQFHLSYLEDRSALVADAIRHVQRLQVFKYPQHCTDDVIFQLRLHCPRLTEVDVSGSTKVTNDSAPYMIEFTELKWLHLKGARIDDKNYGFIISKLPNIANIGFGHNESSVLYHTGVDTLNTITHISGCFHEIEAVSQMCPNTTNITLSSFGCLIFANVRDLTRFTAFNALRALEICGVNCYESEWRAFLKGIGRRLQDLMLNACSNVNLQDIVTLCPSLVNLCLNQCPDLHLNTSLNPQLPHFRNLINLKINQTSEHSVDFRYIRYYVNVETIHLRAVNIFTVEYLREVINQGTFQQLEVFRVMERAPGALTVEGLDLLIGHCPLLKRIEGLRSCPKLDIYRVLNLREKILQQNFDLVIEN